MILFPYPPVRISDNHSLVSGNIRGKGLIISGLSSLCCSACAIIVVSHN
ncbi:MAG: hypothetical protein IJT36_06190 [Alphaproteobacteria bacterium]|nr:hypothetical protein [Alphaproteobacteria bacterium]